MTLIQAQHVVSADGRAGGVNIFTFSFLDSFDLSGNAAAVFDAASQAKKRLMFAIREVDAQPLHVLSFLDIVARTAQKRSETAAALQRSLARWPGTSGLWGTEEVALRFDTARGIDGPHQAIELRRLVQCIYRSTSAQEVPARPTAPPPGHVVIVRQRTPIGVRFEVQPGSLRSLRLALPAGHVVSRSAFVALEAYDAFEYFAATQIEGEIATALTGLRHQQLDALCGGAVVEEDGATVWRSPALQLAAMAPQ